MKLTKSLYISLAGKLTVSLSLDKPKGYFNSPITLSIYPGGSGPWNADIAWGDGETSTMTDEPRKPFTNSHNYITIGNFTITVDVFDQGTGMMGTNTIGVQIAEALTITFTVDKTSGVPPLDVKFNGNISKGYAPYSWSIDFGDGTAKASGNLTSAGAIPEQAHTYGMVGNYQAVLTVIDATGEAVFSLASVLAEGEGVLLNIAPLLVAIPLIIIGR